MAPLSNGKEINESEEFVEARVLEVENDEENPKEVQNVNMELLNQLEELIRKIKDSLAPGLEEEPAEE